MAIQFIDLIDIDPNPFQPSTRWPLDPDSVRELADDLKANGLIHTPVGRIADGRIQIGVGHRRVVAHSLAFPDQPIPIDIRELSDRQMYDYVIAEGSQRLDWSAIEKGERMADYMARFGVTQTETAKRFGLSQGAASNLIRLARDLPAQVKPLVQSRQLPERFARAVVSLARIDQDMAASIGREIAETDESQRDNHADELIANFLGDHAKPLDQLIWPEDWKPDMSAEIDGKTQTPPACSGCPFVESAFGYDYCTRPACYDAKFTLWQTHELERVSKKFSIQIAGPDEILHILQVDWHNNEAAIALLKDKSSGRDHLRLLAYDEEKHSRQGNYYLRDILGSKEVLLGSLRKGFEISAKKTAAAPKSDPATETPAQKSKREAREEQERAARRDEKGALRRAKADVLWLLTNTAERMAPEMKISGGVLDYCYDRMHAQGYFNHQDWPEFITFERDLLSKIKASTSDVREDRVRMAILLGQLRRDIADYRPETEFSLPRAIEIVSREIGKTFKLELPKGWDDIPIHKTSSNCHICGKFTSLDHVTQVDQAAGWQVAGDLVTCSDECRQSVPSVPVETLHRNVSKPKRVAAKPKGKR